MAAKLARTIFVLLFWPVQLMDHGPKGFWKAITDFVRYGK